jgi:hypothetical protein
MKFYTIYTMNIKYTFNMVIPHLGFKQFLQIRIIHKYNTSIKAI